MRALILKPWPARWLSPLLVLIAWQLASRTGLISEQVLSSPTAVLARLAEMIVSGELPANLVVSLRRAAAGFVFGVVPGVILALAAGLARSGDAMIDPLLQAKRTIPVVALTPLFIVWFGIGEVTKVMLIAFAVVLPVYVNLRDGIRGVDVRLIDAARSFGLGQTALIWHVILPGALPALLTGLRYAMSVSVLMLVLAEQVNASAGIGFIITNARDAMRTDVIMACLIVYAALGLGGDFVVRALERRLLQWRPLLVKA